MKWYQFSLRTLIAAAICAGLLMAEISCLISQRQRTESRRFLQGLGTAITEYSTKFGAYPPDESPGLTSSQVLYDYLLPNTWFKLDENEVFKDSKGKCAIISPYGSEIEYRILRDADNSVRGYALVDAGKDRLPGGTLHPVFGFQSNNSDANRDGVIDSKDNVISQFKN